MWHCFERRWDVSTVLLTVIDDIDREIIGALVDDGRMSFRVLGYRVGLSANATGARVARLLDEATISVHAHVHAEMLGRPIEAFIDCRLRQPDESAEFDDAVAADPRIEEAAFVTGNFDYVLRVHVESTTDLDSLLVLLRRHGAAETNTRLILRRFGPRGIPLAPEAATAASR